MAGDIVEILQSLGAPGKIGVGLVVLRHIFPQVADAMGENLAQGYRSALTASGSLFIQALEKAKSIRSMELPSKVPRANVVVPLIETALLEEDEYIRSRWTEMLLNAMDESCKIEVTRQYVSILQDCTRLDVRNLALIRDAYLRQPRKRVWTMLLPREIFWDSDERAKDRMNEHPSSILPSAEVQRNLWNCHCLGLIAPAVLQQGDNSLNMVEITALGVGLVEVSTAPQAVSEKNCRV